MSSFLRSALQIIVYWYTVTALDLNTTDCGQTVNCLLVPNGCGTSKECQIIVKYKKEGSDMIDIVIHGKNDGWIAFGLIEEKRQMGGAHGEVCYHAQENMTLKGFVTEGTHFKMHELDPSTMEGEKKLENGKLTCRYKRKFTGSYMRSALEEFYLIVSWGPIEIKGNNEVEAKEHDVGSYYWSENKVKLADDAAKHSSESFGWIMIAVHGVLMLFAWLQLGSNGIIHARYTRDLYGERTWCGVKVWFQAHRMNMALCYCFTAIGFVIIFVESKKISVDFKLHAILGIIATILATINVIGGIFRPDRDSSMRVAFNWMHRISGIVSATLSVICMITGLSWLHVLAVPVFVAVAVAVIAAIIIEITRRVYKKPEDVGRSTFKNEVTASTATITTMGVDTSNKEDTATKVTLWSTNIVFIVNIIATIVAVVLLIIKAKDLDV